MTDLLERPVVPVAPLPPVPRARVDRDGAAERTLVVRDVVRAVVWALVAVALWQVWPQTVGGPMAYVQVSGTSMEPGLRTGDLVAVRRRDGYQVGDVVAYRVPDGQFGERNVVIHRLVGGDGRKGWVTLGDNRDLVDPWSPRDSDVVGEMVWSSAGRGDDLARLAQPVPLGLLTGGLTTLVLLWPDRRRRVVAPVVVPMVLDGLRLVPLAVPDPGRSAARGLGTVVVGWIGSGAPARCTDLPRGAVRLRPGTVRVALASGPVAVASWSPVGPTRVAPVGCAA
ncbi:MAG: signal peptidase I [Mycobacteriales bacterium]|nr:signal peptidase I [Mycobacteriales bacterium]